MGETVTNVLLTIYIPTYNRLWKLSQTLEKLLQYEDGAIEIVLSDDSTNEDTYDYVKALGDNRIVYYRRTQFGIGHIREAVEKSGGKYFLILLDKDTIKDCIMLKRFVLFLRENSDVTFGRCALEPARNHKGREYVIYHDRIHAFRQMAYRDWHPSGFFFSTKLLRKKMLRMPEDTILIELIAEILLEAGNGAIYKKRLVNTESEKEAEKTLSIAYNGVKEEDLFFSPAMREKQFKRWASHLSKMQVEEEVKMDVLLGIAWRSLESATFLYKNIMNNKKLCEHYRIRNRNIKKIELIRIAVVFAGHIRKFSITTFSFSLKNKVSFVWSMFVMETRFIKKLVCAGNT